MYLLLILCYGILWLVLRPDLLTSLNSATCFCENIEKTLEPARFARLEEDPLDDWRVEPDGVVGVGAADGVAAGVSSGVASTVASPSFAFFLVFFTFSDYMQTN